MSPGEIERLAILAEECGEVAQAVGKVLRFGWEGQSPYGGRVNRVALEREVGNLRAIVNLMLDSRTICASRSCRRGSGPSAWGWGSGRSTRRALISREERLALIEEIAATVGK